MHRYQTRLIALGIVAVLAACDRQPDTEAAATDGAAPTAAAGMADADAPRETTTGTAPDEAAQASPALLDEDGAPVPMVDFDRDSVPPASAAPGALPLFSMPRGYRAERPRTRAHARFPFRLGDGLHWVEGPSWSASIRVDHDVADKQFSPLEIRRNLEGVLAQAGAKRVFQGPLQRGLYYGSIEDEVGHGYIDVVNHGDADTDVFVIRHGDRTVWVQLVVSSHEAGVVVVDEQPFEATARWTGEFPYLSLPAGYERRNQPLQRDYDAFPFWTGSAFEDVEGKAYAVDFDAGGDATSRHEVQRNLEAMMAQAGGVLVHDGPVPAAESEKIDSDRKAPYGNAVDYSWDKGRRSTWRVDLDGGRQVWVHALLEPRRAGWVVVERTGFEQTSALLPADALKARIDSDGRVAIEVNFAVDEAGILPESTPQIAQVVELLRADSGLRLSVDGHTDGSGDAARNRALSEARAQAVVAALVDAGIDGGRLQARGHGADQPVADNASDAGKARNRRVELVKR